MKERKLRKAVVLLTVLALVICMAQTVAFAQNTVDVSDGVYANGSITVTGSISTKGAYMNMLAIRTSNQNFTTSDLDASGNFAEAIMFMDQVTATSDNFEKTWTFPVKDTVEGNYVVIFVSGTDASVARTVVELESTAPVYENGTATLAAYTGGRTYFLAGTQEPALVLTGDDAWKAQLNVAVTGENAAFDPATGAITFDAPDELTNYTLTINNTDTNYPAYSKTYSFKYISAAGDEFAKLPANLGVTVNKADDKYTFTVPADTANITFTATVDGAAVAGKTFDVDKADADKTVVITAAANGTALTKDYTVTVPAAEATVPTVDEADIEVIEGEDGDSVYADFIEGDNVIVTINAGDIDPETQRVTVGGVELYYVASRDYFVGIVPAYADKAALAADVVIENGASDRIVYGKNPNGDIDEPIDTSDFAAVKKIALTKGKVPTAKQLLSADVGNGEMDGYIDTADFAAIKKVALGKADDLAINKG